MPTKDYYETLQEFKDHIYKNTSLDINIKHLDVNWLATKWRERRNREERKEKIELLNKEWVS